MSASSSSPANTFAVTLQILTIVFYTFIAFLCIGLPIAVLPGYVHDQLGFSAVIAGLTIGLQYLPRCLAALLPDASPTAKAPSRQSSSD